MTETTRRGLRFHTSSFGSGPPVVMLHGLLTGSVATWYFTCAPRLAAQWRPFMYDMRGHGHSDRPDTGYGSVSMAQDLAELTADLPPFPIVAHSYGCLVAARFAEAHPERVTAMALVEPPFGLDLREPLNVDAVVSAGRALQPRQAAKLRSLIDETTILDDVAAEPEFTDAMIAALPRHLLFVFGDRSPCRSGTAAILQARPSAEIVVLPGGHDVHAESTAELTEMLLDFLDASAPPSGPAPLPAAKAGIVASP